MKKSCLYFYKKKIQMCIHHSSLQMSYLKSSITIKTTTSHADIVIMNILCLNIYCVVCIRYYGLYVVCNKLLINC